MNLQTTADIPLRITSENSSSERRITPSWTIAQLKSKLEPVTGIPPSCQRLSLRISNQQDTLIEATDEEFRQLASFPLQAYAELYVHDTRPPSARNNLTDPSAVPKYTMPTSTYETLPNSVLAFKKSHKLGRFDPNAPEAERQKLEKLEREVEERGLTLSSRCRVNGSSLRHGTIRYIGVIPEISNSATAPKTTWIGVELDEPVGKNDGSIHDARYFSCRSNHGVFVRPDRVEVGEFPVIGDLEEMEEI